MTYMSDDGKCCEEKHSRVNWWANEASVNRLKLIMFLSVLNILIGFIYFMTAINSVLLPVMYYHIFTHQCIPWLFSKNLESLRYYSRYYFYLSDVDYSILNIF